jgi:autotransporter-associated beta strand protein
MVRNSTETMTFDVANVTADAAPDLSIPGVIRDYDPGLAGLPIIKTGAGTVSLSGANTHTGPITLTAGALVLGADNTLNTGNPITLSGGTLETGAFSNGVGTLTVASNSAIALGSGKLAFADSSATSWTGTLTLTGTLAAQTVRVGTNDRALTGEQLASIRLDGGRVRIKSDGYLAPSWKGTFIWLQ